MFINEFTMKIILIYYSYKNISKSNNYLIVQIPDQSSEIFKILIRNFLKKKMNNNLFSLPNFLK